MIVGNAIPWSEEDLNLIKEYGKDLEIDELINLLSVKRTRKAIQHKLSKFGIHRKHKIIKNYNEIKFKYIDGTKYKLCKQCERYLPCSEDYFPIDTNMLEGIRNVCRECKGELFKVNSNVYRWTEEDVDLMLNYYSNMTNKELIKYHLPHLDSYRIIQKAHYLGIYKSQEALDRSAQQAGDFHANRLSLLNKWQGEDNPYYNSQRFGELNPNYKGGITSLFSEMRRNITQWKIDSAKQCNFSCVVTGWRFDHIHHLYSFNKIAQETLEELGLYSVYDDIYLYTKEELKIIIDKCLEIHYRYPLGVCLTKDIHKKFHFIYGYKDNNPEQFYEFINNL